MTSPSLVGPTIDLRPFDAFSDVELLVVAEDLTTVLFATSPAALGAAPHLAMATVLASVDPVVVAASYRDGEGQLRSVLLRLVVPARSGGVALVEVWPDTPGAAADVHRGGAHPALAAALEVAHRSCPAEGMLDVYLSCVLRAAGVDSVIALARDDAGVTVLASASFARVPLGDRLTEDALRAAYPELLAAAPDARTVVLGYGPARRPRPVGWLADALLRTVPSHAPLRSIPDDDVCETMAARTVVSVDDDPASLELMHEVFALVPEFELITVATLSEAAAAIGKHRPEVVIVDAWMGDQSAEGFVCELLAAPAANRPAIVILSADANASTMTRFRRLGVSSYLAKPIDLSVLTDAVCKLSSGEGTSRKGNGNRARTIAAFGN